ncbi:hypothetical protein OKA05_08700 [Luteolibacter arcticus]|uniref:Uncharacterized protein n=1 Tax=Luteolibacter arcticus TaxID=1581411 RepID=A0ABT3GG95_9BACT|nr:hypothetical protein [Luteolibacter arcticus]MCW1922631.1 hypothetical protein [Luteolibacter arcticus]
MKPLLLFFAIATVLLFSSCSSAPSPDPVSVAVTDTEPLGEGIKTLAYALLGASVVITLGRLLR